VAQEWEVVDCASDPAHAVAVVAREQIDTVLMDLCFPGGDTGIEGIESVRASAPDTKIIVLTASSDPALITRAVQAGADDIVFKDDEIDNITNAIERVVNGRRPGARPAYRPPPNRRDDNELLRFLTQREIEVLKHLVRGESGKQMARALGISYSTTRTHIQNVLAKLGVHSRLEAVALAVEHGVTDA
jgi:two-component system, NarL family, nitrate/nitrite response regulator NarL